MGALGERAAGRRTRRMVIARKGSSIQERTDHKQGLGRRLFNGLALRSVALPIQPEMHKSFHTFYLGENKHPTKISRFNP
jgi:hypothetical protein